MGFHLHLVVPVRVVRSYLVVTVFAFLGQSPYAIGQVSGDSTHSPVTASKRVQEDIQKLKGQARETDSRLSQVQTAVDGIKSKLDEGGWKALDVAHKFSTLQLQVFGFVLALMGFGGFGGYQAYKWLRDKLENDLRESMRAIGDETRHSNQAMTFSHASFAFWQQFNEGNEDSSKYGERKHYLETAIALSKFAVENAGKLEPLNKEEHEVLITTIRSNHSYWLAQQTSPTNPKDPHPQNSESALSLGKAAYAIADKYRKLSGTKNIDRWPNWIENYCFVLARYGDDQQKAEAKEIIKTICDDQRVNEAWKKQIRKEYGVPGLTQQEASA